MRFSLIFFIFFGLLDASEFWIREFAAAQKTARETGRLIMVEAMREHCRYCRVMDENVFDNRDVQAVILQRVVPVRVDLDKDAMPAGITARVTPSFYFLDAEGNLRKKVVGGWNREDFLEIITKIGE